MTVRASAAHLGVRQYLGLSASADGSDAGFLNPWGNDGHDFYTVNRPRQEIWILEGLQEPRAWWERLLGKE